MPNKFAPLPTPKILPPFTRTHAARQSSGWRGGFAAGFRWDASRSTTLRFPSSIHWR